MPINVQWEDEQKQIIRQTFDGAWTWQQFIHACIDDDGNAGLMRSVTHTVHIVADFTRSGPIPFGGAMSQARSVMRYYPDNWGTLIVVTQNTFIRSLVSAYHRAYMKGVGAKTFSATTVEDARVQIAAWERKHAPTA